MGVPTGEEGPNPELVDFTRRFWVGAALTLPVFLLAMAPHVGLPLRDWLGERAAVWLELILSTPVVLWAGWPFLVRGWKSIVNRSLNMFTLIAMGVSAAYVFSVVATLAPQDRKHTSELQSLMRISYAVFCLKKKTNKPHKQTDVD